MLYESSTVPLGILCFYLKIIKTVKIIVLKYWQLKGNKDIKVTTCYLKVYTFNLSLCTFLNGRFFGLVSKKLYEALYDKFENILKFVFIIELFTIKYYLCWL